MNVENIIKEIKQASPQEIEAIKTFCKTGKRPDTTGPAVAKLARKWQDKYDEECRDACYAIDPRDNDMRWKSASGGSYREELYVAEDDGWTSIGDAFSADYKPFSDPVQNIIYELEIATESELNTIAEKLGWEKPKPTDPRKLTVAQLAWRWNSLRELSNAGHILEPYNNERRWQRSIRLTGCYQEQCYIAKDKGWINIGPEVPADYVPFSSETVQKSMNEIEKNAQSKLDTHSEKLDRKRSRQSVFHRPTVAELAEEWAERHEEECQSADRWLDPRDNAMRWYELPNGNYQQELYIGEDECWTDIGPEVPADYVPNQGDSETIPDKTARGCLHSVQSLWKAWRSRFQSQV
jgi:uncharacterized protein (DUF305 family)